MAALPKRKLSKGRSARRRSHMALQPVQLVPCQQCHALHRPHHVCPACGTYRGRKVIEVKSKTRAGEAAS
jgi:large subunit ribosomal protein L32